jgi:hypothetical protein
LSKAWWTWSLVIVVALLTLAVGFCLFDQDDHSGAGLEITLPGFRW